MTQRLPGLAKFWTRRAVLLLETALVLFWFGITLQNARLIVVSATILAYMILALGLSINPTTEVTLQRQLASDRTFEEHPQQATSILTSQRRSLVQVSELYPANFEIIEGSGKYVALTKPNFPSQVLEVFKVDFRGHYVIPPPLAKSTDELGLQERPIKTAQQSYLSVLPPIEDISDFSLDSRVAQPEIGTFRSGTAGVGTEFFAIREYLPGDELRRINWKASARTSWLLSNEYEKEHVTNIYLVVDLTGTQIEGLKWTVRTAASIATYLLKTRNRLGLIVLGESISHVHIESGRRQLLRVLDKLITVEPGGTGEPSTYLIRLLDEMPPCEILAVSTLSTESVSKTILTIKEKRQRVTVITAIPELPEAERQDLLLRAASLVYALRRRGTIHQLKNAQVKVAEVPLGRPIRTAVSIIRERPLRR